MTDGPIEQPAFALTEYERQTPLWVKMKKELEARRDALRRRNDNPNLDATKTALLRGELIALTKLLALGEGSDPATTVADADEG